MPYGILTEDSGLMGIRCTACNRTMADHNKDELEKCKLICELVNLQRSRPEFGKKIEKCTCSVGSMYKNLGRSDCPNCGGKF